MTLLKTSIQSVVSGWTSLGMMSGWGAALGVAAIATATPAAACGPEPYIGSICTFAFNYCPEGYVEADGRTLPVNQNQALYALIGNIYGGNTNDFNVPDFRARTAIGRGMAPGFNAVDLRQKVGQQSIVLDDAQVPLRKHAHVAGFQGTGGGSTRVSIPAKAGSLGVTAKLQALQVTGAAQPQTGKFLGMGGSGSQQAPIYATPTAATTAVDLGGLEVKLTGSAGNGPIEFDIITGITGGIVSVQSAEAPVTKAVSTQSPGLGMTVCIARNGLYPIKP